MRKLLLAVLLCPAPGWAGSLSGQGAFVLDQGGAQRPSFSSSERVVLRQQVFNSVASGGRITFRFFLISPTGAQIFQHVGNAVPGSVGNSASQVSGVPVSQFYTGPGFYTLRAEAELDGVVTTQQAQFSISSPNILLVYPPNGARDVADNPLTFRWSASGASRYRVLVGDNPSMYNSIFGQETAGAESFLSYPQNPSDERQRLTAGQVYYWTVEGIDPAGNVVAKTEIPFNYSVRATALAKDLAVTEFMLDGSVGQDGAVKLLVRVANQGNTTENSVSLRIGVGGLPAQGTPLAVTLLSPAESREFNIQGMMPVDQKQTLATACLELFDDNVPNNCRTFSVTRPEAPAGVAPPVAGAVITPGQMLDVLKELLKERGIDLNDYDTGAIPPDKLAALIDGLRQGTVQASVVGVAVKPPAGGQPPAGPIPTVGSDARKAAPDFGGAPDASTETDEGKESEVTLDQALSRLNEALKKLGIDLAQFTIPKDLAPERLAALAKGLADGTVKAAVVGGAPAGSTASSGAVSRTYAPPPLETPPPILVAPSEDLPPEEEEAGGAEWTGMAGPAGKGPYTMTIRDADDWAKRWGRLRDGRAPELDFKKTIVVGVVAGSMDRAERVEIESVQVGEEGLVVRYKLVVEGKSGEPDKARTRVPWTMRHVKASPGLDVRFERAEEGGDR